MLALKNIFFLVFDFFSFRFYPCADFALKEWIVADGFGAETKIILSDLKYNERLNPRLFVIRDDNRRDRR